MSLWCPPAPPPGVSWSLFWCRRGALLGFTWAVTGASSALVGEPTGRLSRRRTIIIIRCCYLFHASEQPSGIRRRYQLLRLGDPAGQRSGRFSSLPDAVKVAGWFLAAYCIVRSLQPRNAACTLATAQSIPLAIGYIDKGSFKRWTCDLFFRVRMSACMCIRPAPKDSRPRAAL